MAGPLDRIPPYLIHREFLPDVERQAMFDWAIANEAAFSASKVGLVGNIDPAMRNSLNVHAKIDRPWHAPLRARLMAMLPQWRAAFGLAPFELAKIELDLIAYNDGAFYRRHSDMPARNRVSDTEPPGDRLITAVYYFHGRPKGFDGGALRLYPLARPAAGEAERFVDIPPDQNSLAVFPSWAPHEVLPVRCPSGVFADSRFAVNCWVRRAREG